MAKGLLGWLARGTPPMVALPCSLLTWEPLEQPRQQFPQVPAWGHAVSQEGDVNDAQAIVVDKEQGPSDNGQGEAASRPRGRLSNLKLSGPEWVH